MSKTEITLSPYQQGVIDWVANGKGSAVVIAVAGAGKTFTIEQSLPRIPEDKYVSLLAFNKTIADELKVRITKMGRELGRPFSRVQAKTFHSMGGAAVAKRLGKRSVRDLVTTDKKLRDLCGKLMPAPEASDDFSQGQTEYAMYADFICKLVGYAKGVGIRTRLLADTEANWWELIHHHDMSLESEDANEDRAIELARQLLVMSNKQAQEGVIDFDDMLYLPILWNLRLFQVDWVVVDEAQDTSPVRRELARMNLRPNGRAMFVGDPKQAIYGFTGASADAIEVIKDQFGAIELPLTVCYRCATSVVEHARQIVPYIEPAPNAPVGKVETMAEKDALAVLDEHDAILCRNTAPLIQTAMQLIAKGRAAKVLGRDIGVGLVNLVKKMRAKGIEQLEDKLEAYRQRETAKFMARGEETKVERVNDTVECIKVIIANMDESKDRTVPGVIAKIEGLFSDTNGCLILSTVHKAKGKEWPRVAILQPELMPSKWAKQQWQQEQESNLRYVAFTRAREHLIIMTTAKREG